MKSAFVLDVFVLLKKTLTLNQLLKRSIYAFREIN